MVKKILILILLVLSINIVGCSKVLDNLGINNGPGDLGVLIWPDTELSNMLPKPKTESNVGRVEELTDDTFMVHVGGVSEEYFDEYVGECILFGFNKNLSFKDNVFTAKNAAGYSLHMKYSKNVMSIKLESPVLFDDDTNNEGNNELVNDFSNVFPGATEFEDITATLTIDPACGVSAVYKEKTGKGYVFVASKTNSPMRDLVNVTVGVDKNGKVTGISVSFNNPSDYPVSDNTLSSFVGQDSTLAGVELTAKATVSSNAVKKAVKNGFSVLIANDLLTAATKPVEAVFEELLPTIVTGFVTDKNSELPVSGNIYKALKSKNNTTIVCHVNSGDTKLLAIANISGKVVLYKANLVDEATQAYELVEVTAENAAIAEEVSTFAKAKLSTTFTILNDKLIRMYDDKQTTDIVEVSEIIELPVSTQGCISSGASFVYEGATYYAYRTTPVNRFSGNPVMEIYVILDSDGKIVKVDIAELYFNEEYWRGQPSMDETEYKNGFVGLDTESYDGSQSLITGATFSPNAVNEAIEAVFAEFANLY